MYILFTLPDTDSTTIVRDFITDDFTLTDNYYNELKPVDDSITLKMPFDIELANAFKTYGNDNILAQVRNDDDTNIFTGYLRKSFTFEKTQRNQPISIEIVSPSYFLDIDLSDDYYAVNQTVSYLVVKLLGLTGRVISYSFTGVTDIVPVFDVSEGDNIADILTDLLYQYGYCYDFDADGKFILNPLFNQPEENITQIFNGTNSRESVKIDRKEETASLVKIKWGEVDYYENMLLFSDTTDGDTTNKCNIEIEAGKYLYDTKENYLDYDSTLGTVRYATSITQGGIVFNSGIEVKEFENKGLKALLSMYNGTDGELVVTKMDIYGNAYIQKTEDYTNAGSTGGKTEEYEAKYIQDYAHSYALARNICNYYRYADFTVSLKSKTKYAVGTFVKVTDYGTGTITGRIVQRVTDGKMKLYQYKIEAVSEYSPAEVDAQPTVHSGTDIPDVYKLIQESGASIAETAAAEIEKVRNGDIVSGAIALEALNVDIQTKINDIDTIAANIASLQALNETNIDEMLAALDETLMNAQDGIVQNDHRISLSVSSLQNETRSLIALEDDKITAAVSDGKEDTKSAIELFSDEIIAMVDDALSGAQSSIIQTATMIESVVQDNSGNISILQQTAESLTSQIQSNNGDISTLQQTSESITQAVQNLSESTAADITVQSNRIDAFVAGGGTTGFFALSLALPVVISASTRTAFVNASTEALVAAVYVPVTEDGTNVEYMINSSATAANSKSLWAALRASGLLGSQFSVDADTILLNGKIYIGNVTDSTGGTIIDGGKINTDLINVDEILATNAIVTAQLKIDSAGEIVSSDFYNITNGAESGTGYRLKSGIAKFMNIYIAGNSKFAGEIESGPLLLTDDTTPGITKTIYAGINIYNNSDMPPTNTKVIGLFNSISFSYYNVSVEVNVTSTHVYYKTTMILYNENNSQVFSGNSGWIIGSIEYDLPYNMTWTAITTGSKTFRLNNLPTSEPSVSGTVWNSNGVLKIKS